MVLKNNKEKRYEIVLHTTVSQPTLLHKVIFYAIYGKNAGFYGATVHAARLFYRICAKNHCDA